MDVAIVYESMYGNTREVAEAIAEGVHDFDPRARVDLMPVAQAEPGKVAEADLLVVGGPTHIMRMSSERTRQAGAESARKAAQAKGAEPHLEPGAPGKGVRDWLAALPRPRQGCRAAAFDTRMKYPMAGGAAKPIARQLRHHGYKMAGSATGFVVAEGEGPLREGEHDRARAWGTTLAGELAGRGSAG